MSKVYKAVNVINRGRGTKEVLPGTLFVPAAKDVDFFVEVGAVVEPTEAELALYKATNKGAKAAEPVTPTPAQAAELTAAEQADALAEAHDRAALNKMAGDLGIADPDKMANKGLVADAIVKAQSAASSAGDLIG